MKLFPMMKDDHKESTPPPLPWPVAEAIYEHLYNCKSDQSLERIAERGGFSYGEIRVMAEWAERKRDREARCVHGKHRVKDGCRDCGIA